MKTLRLEYGKQAKGSSFKQTGSKHSCHSFCLKEKKNEVKTAFPIGIHLLFNSSGATGVTRQEKPMQKNEGLNARQEVMKCHLV